MHTDEPREIQGVELGYDPRDIDLKRILKIVVYFFAFATVFFGGGAIYYIYIGRIETSQHFDARKPPIIGPKIQGNISAKLDIMTMRQNERRLMESYGTNPDGKQRIPVAHAMDLLAQRGLPVVTSDKTATSPGNTIEQNATGPAKPGPASRSTPTTPADPGPVPTPDYGQGAAGATAGGAGAASVP